MVSKKNGAVPPAFAGKSVAIVETRDHIRDPLQKLLQAEGAKVVKDVTPALDMLVTKDEGATSPLERRAQQLNKAGKAKIEIISEWGLRKSLLPTRDETLAMLRGDAKSRDRWDDRMLLGGHSVNLSGESFRGADLRDVSLESVKLDGADLRDTKLKTLPQPIKGANLDGAHFTWGILCAIGCSMKGIEVVGPTDVDFSGSDLTGATLTESNNLGHLYKKTILRDAKLTRWSLQEANLEGADLTGADLRKAEITKAKAQGAVFARANLTGADLSGADLRGADLRGADLTGANLTGTDLTGAKVDGATFDDAILTTSTKLGKVATRKAKGFALPENPFVAGPCIKKLEGIMTKAKVEAEVRVDLEKGCVKLKVHTYRGGGAIYHQWRPDPLDLSKVQGGGGSGYSNTVAAAFEAVSGRWLKGRLRPDTLKVSSKGSPVSGKELKDLFLGAWREAMGAEAAESADAAKGKVAPTGKERAATLLDLLRGKGGVEKWNALASAERTPAGGFRGADLANANLAGVDFRDLDFQKAKFDGADLDGAALGASKLAGASFAAANMRGAVLRRAVVRGASFRGARLADADFTGTDVRKVDFTDAKLTGADFEEAVFDETTILPLGFRPPKDMVWKGKSADPRVAPKSASGAPKVIDASALMKRLVSQTDKSRFDKALKMLKADRFKLFVEVNDDRLDGVVKSQTDKELVYVCALAADGSYACCSQNLNPCGGLRGALCKHLLVLIIGLVKGGQIEPTRVDGWIAAGRGRAPSLEKDAMARILLRFKGAESGEVDWRPMETVPEDYYAM
ncbi:MAG TPA: pentapeptide repeat-containing protein [Polyangia bacterium]|jgi:uncharacterized protein YjbI with pentapeptide repeats|nr:pentapeptide repeat-containing protein [Polyangia bacterium]